MDEPFRNLVSVFLQGFEVCVEAVLFVLLVLKDFSIRVLLHQKVFSCLDLGLHVAGSSSLIQCRVLGHESHVPLS